MSAPDLPRPSRLGRTKDGKPFDFYEKKMVASGKWRPETVPPEVSGVSRPLDFYRAVRKGPFVTPWDRDDLAGYCPMHWADLKIGRGACGLRCRRCFLIGTHRTFCNPSRHVLYINVDDCIREVKLWLKRPTRRSLGLGTDSSDSLLYEGVTGYARRLIPLFASPDFNPHGCQLLLLSKTANAHFLEGLPVRNVLVTWSLNPEPIADLWEGKYDDGVRVTPPIEKRLAASLLTQEMGFEVRWRVDPILTPEDWKEAYWGFFQDAAGRGHRPTRITLGTYRETTPALKTMAAAWGLPPMEWVPANLIKEGMHYHVPREERIQIYMRLVAIIKACLGRDWPCSRDRAMQGAPGSEEGGRFGPRPLQLRLTRRSSMMAAIRTKRLKDPRDPQDGTRVFVARYRPRFLRKGAEQWDEWIKELAPSRELHATWYGKGGRKPISFEEFTRRYEEEMQAQKETINKLARRVLAGETITLLCYCADESKCHRTLLKGMIEEAILLLRQGR